MSVRATTENGLRAGSAPFEMAEVSALGMAETARVVPATSPQKQGQGLYERI